MVDNDLVAEAAVVGYPHNVKGESVYAYIVLKKENGDVDSSGKQDLLIMNKNKIEMMMEMIMLI